MIFHFSLVCYRLVGHINLISIFAIRGEMPENGEYQLALNKQWLDRDRRSRF